MKDQSGKHWAASKRLVQIKDSMYYNDELRNYSIITSDILYVPPFRSFSLNFLPVHSSLAPICGKIVIKSLILAFHRLQNIV